jgi:hypothetical protein
LVICVKKFTLENFFDISENFFNINKIKLQLLFINEFLAFMGKHLLVLISLSFQNMIYYVIQGVKKLLVIEQLARKRKQKFQEFQTRF